MAESRKDIAVSLLVPVYNVESYLEEALASAVGQTLQNIEIVCIDDGSTDGSSAILDAYAARDKRMRVFHKENGGYGKAMNLALELA
ncbi:MAG: glycosyltransferase family 2 protein, partial [Selenomonadaceae bacterium]|nr:glycosyltransferase family 2 protein [Selenomonadaceae bacterium]